MLQWFLIIEISIAQKQRIMGKFLNSGGHLSFSHNISKKPL